MYKQRTQILLTYARMNSLLTEFQKDDLRNPQGENSRLDHISRLKDDIANFEAQHQDVFGKIINQDLTQLRKHSQQVMSEKLQIHSTQHNSGFFGKFNNTSKLESHE